MELFPVDYLKQLQDDGKMKKLFELRDLCLNKGQEWMSEMGPYSTVNNLFHRMRFFVFGDVKN